MRDQERVGTLNIQNRVLIIEADDHVDRRFNPAIEAGLNQGFRDLLEQHTLTLATLAAA